MNLKKALVGCILAISLSLGAKGNLLAVGEHFPPINAGKTFFDTKVAEGEHFPPINAGPYYNSKVVAEGEHFPPINAGPYFHMKVLG
ncbi:hypothetical protein [Bacillus sp. FJAT-49736]|uniref:hypothetical protein n=1 Tax=Bacillus sp. FJAT-49736 TaxID=2833582 RepID=UPI001BC969C4|nr:hypothetical protein [Bacillus sp. FJAT-49736]MBS4175156.1 hypothetical protein [Bacillus sp. FJAT-49736]